MTFARTVSRVAGAVIAFVVGYGYCVIVALTPQVVCEGPSSSPFMAANIFAAALVPSLLLAGLALEWRTSLRWVTLPFVLLAPLAAMAAAGYLDASTHAAMAACNIAGGEPEASAARPWHAWWAAAHLAVLALLTVQSLRFWRTAPRQGPCRRGGRRA